ncbi:TadE/TadG family type IV pilus assembly protein [Microbacterium sp.]|uniref:TadE/TadG family type IV pilus assembly protein n=1 Tax=Microbacterium sp. TaxID=51671 RepID=UPI00262ED3BD|nr:TadE/TadG family type IV pilus assembly protein [Microbacterium sp.]
MRWRAAAADERGSSAVEFVLVGSLLTVLTLAVLQLGLAIYVRNVVHDAAVEGAHYAALADTTLLEGAERTKLSIARAVGESFADDITVAESDHLGYPTAVITVRTTLPVIGLLGVPYAMEVEADAPLESLGEQ